MERTLLVLPRDARRSYLRLVAAAAPAIEAELGERVVANRAATWSIDPPALTLRPWRLERRVFAEALRTLAGAHRALLFADVAACYASIRPPVVRAALEAVGAPGGDAVQAFLADLGGWGVRGLPVGPEPSALLANAVLSHVDAALQVAGIEHLRWVDDLVLGLAGPREAEAALTVVRAALAELGLRPNERKTRVVADPTALVTVPSMARGRARAVG